MKKINGFYYSTKPLEDYKFRAKFEYSIYGVEHTKSFDIYTDNPNKKEVEDIFKKAISTKFNNSDNSLSKIVHWVTKKQDDLTAEFIESFFNE